MFTNLKSKHKNKLSDVHVRTNGEQVSNKLIFVFYITT